ncbi:PilX N-terminal domain-containing pilus assembly protein [Pseudomonas sp. RIT-PI-S]|uniref:pilus assembly PilX family protein n=1 Tax=Pseudomonas sp. RIT-PI-S TaxID=3035295 RepID=UPI0021DA441F|nr:PilX N-terminal domain-containing pilus assembly protein [Pseudomonas sp. RIT-PI-S]
MSPRFTSPPAERGMALIVALVFLLLLTLLGLNSMQNATLQEKMSNSVQFRNQSFQLAEAALRVGEGAVSASTYALALCANAAACAPPTDSSTVPAAGNGLYVTWVTAGDGALYGVQRLGTTTGGVWISGQSATLYRITGVGIVGSARTVLESIYAKY